jgi:transposase
MRFVPIKNVEQQAVLALHRVRQGFVKARTAQANQIRGLLGEFGLIVPQGIGYIASRVPELIEDAGNELPGSFRVLVRKPSINHALARGVGTDARRAVYGLPSSMFQGSSAS